ncbi:MAG: flagellar hook-associated protein FlgL [Desulfovibrio sp.]|jgi:flagellar hook-associated protein 3 FlgL|nr:flagellar hook-associated protein FlgL [Desulfovibrio sp.]
MPIRVTQHMMYHDMVNRMQKNLSAYMESNEQGSSQKRINRPSDDPAGMYRVLTTRNAISSTEQYEANAKTALGWLQLSDNVLSTQVTTAIIGLRELAEQASTGSYDAKNREQMAFKARELFGQLLNLANTEFEGRSIFGGHVYDRPAFEEGLALTSWDENWQSVTDAGGKALTPPPYVISGASDTSILIRFTGVDDGSASPPPNRTAGATGEVGTNPLYYKWSKDGGQTWSSEAVLAPPVTPGDPVVITADGVNVTLPFKDASASPPKGLAVTVADPGLGPGATNGTLLYIRPTAIYMGDDNDPPPEVTFMGKTTAASITPSAQGTFHHDVIVRVDDGTTNPPEVSYSYSTDNGSTWIPAKTDAGAAPPYRFTVPGGYLDLDALPNDGAQVKIHPHRADLDFEIMKDTFLTVNNVGKDIFGGRSQDGAPYLYNDGGDLNMTNDRALSANLFEVVGNFIAYLENNNQEGCQRTLAALTEAEKVILTQAARVGGKENRVQTARDVLSFQKIDQQEQLSNTEDIDLTELLTKLTQQQMAYSTVLKSSSMIMQLSLVNYV